MLAAPEGSEERQLLDLEYTKLREMGSAEERRGSWRLGVGDGDAGAGRSVHVFEDC